MNKLGLVIKPCFKLPCGPAIENYSSSASSETCGLRSPLGPTKSGLLSQVQIYRNVDLCSY